MPTPTTSGKRPPRLARSLLWRMSAIFIACLLVFGTAFHFLIVAPATQALARVQLDLATRHIQSEAERSFHRMETQLRTARSWGQAERLRLDDIAGFNALMTPLLASDVQISSIHLADADGREIMLMRETDGWRNRITQPATLDKGNRWLHWSTSGKLLDEGWKEGRYDPRNRPWFEAALKATSDDLLAWTTPYRLLTSGDGGITVSTRWRGADGKTLILAFDMLLADLSRLTIDTPVGERGGSAVLTDAGEVVGVPRYPRFANLSDRRDAVLQPAAALNVDFLTHGYAHWLDAGRTAESILKYENENETWLAQFVPMKLGGQEWWVGGFAREADFIPARLHDVAPVLALLIVLSAAAAAHLARKVSRRIETALATIVERSERIGRLDFPPTRTSTPRGRKSPNWPSPRNACASSCTMRLKSLPRAAPGWKKGSWNEPVSSPARARPSPTSCCSSRYSSTPCRARFSTRDRMPASLAAIGPTRKPSAPPAAF